ncbi:hypothetical protein OROMI_012516 [Orobanche minor]
MAYNGELNGSDIALIFSVNNLPTCWNLLRKFARFCGVLTSVASPLARALYLARTIFLPAGIFSTNLHAFVVFSPPFRLHLLQLCVCYNFIAQMEPKIFPLDAITPETKNWTAKVSILNKTEPRTSSQPTSIRFQKLLLADNKENRVEAMLYRGDIELLKNSLRIDQTYLISNTVVRPVKPGFENPLTNNKYQWILGARTAILATGTAAIIIDSHPPRTVMATGKENTLHEYAAFDELLNPFIITFWNDAAPDDLYNLLSFTKERHIIAALNFSVSDYHNISLSSTSAFVVLIKLCIHKERIDVLQQQGDVFRKAHTNFGHDTETFTSIETLLTAEQPYRYDLLARGKVARTNQNFIYPCCAKCHRLTTAAYGRLFECHSCHEIRNATPVGIRCLNRRPEAEAVK